jgi:hypothetical protein
MYDQEVYEDHLNEPGRGYPEADEVSLFPSLSSRNLREDLNELKILKKPI